MLLSAQTLRKIRPVEPFEEKTIYEGKSYGLSVAGYDIRIAEDLALAPLKRCLSFSVEKFTMPNNVLGRVCDKSSWIRGGLRMGNTVIEPGWTGYLTLELFNYGESWLLIPKGVGIAQVLFQYTDEMTDGYRGKYQDAPAKAVKAVYEY